MYPPKYRKEWKKYILDEYKATIVDPNILLKEVEDYLIKTDCIKNTEQLKNSKWLTIWTCIKRWYHQFCFSIGIYMKDEKPIIIFKHISMHPNDFKYFIELHTNVINKCKSINPGILREYNALPLESNIEEKSKEDIQLLIDSIHNCGLIQISEENSRKLAILCDGKTENYIKHQNILINHFPDTIYKMLNSDRSVIIQYCGQALLQILIRNKNDVNRLEIKEYNPYTDNEIELGKKLARELIN